MFKTAPLPGRVASKKDLPSPRVKTKVLEIDQSSGASAPASVSPSTSAVALVPKSGTKLALPIDASTDEFLRSHFGSKSDVIVNMLEYQDTDGAMTLLTRTLLQTLVSIVPLAEHNIRASKGAKGIYQLNQLTTSLREVMIDLHTMREKGQMGQRIVETSLRPAFKDIGVQIVLAFTTIESQARASMQTEDFRVFRDEMLKLRNGLATFMNTTYKDVTETVLNSLS